MAKKNLSDSKIIEKCPECGSTRLMSYYEDKEIVCMDCGFVINSKTLEQSSEPVYDGNLQKKAKTYPTISQTLKNLGKGLSTAIIYDSKNTHGELAFFNQQTRIFEKWQKLFKVSDATERNLALALLEMTRIAEALSLPKIVLEAAATMYKLMVEKRFIRGGRSIRTVSAAAVYAACKQCELARTLDEIASASKIGIREIGRNYKFITKELNVSIPQAKPSQYLPQLSSQLEMRAETKEIAERILEVVDELKLSFGKKPVGITAAVCYISSLIAGEKKTQREITEIAHVTEATIRNRCKELEKLLLFVVIL